MKFVLFILLTHSVLLCTCVDKRKGNINSKGNCFCPDEVTPLISKQNNSSYIKGLLTKVTKLESFSFESFFAEIVRRYFGVLITVQNKLKKGERPEGKLETAMYYAMRSYNKKLLKKLQDSYINTDSNDDNDEEEDDE